MIKVFIPKDAQLIIKISKYSSVFSGLGDGISGVSIRVSHGVNVFNDNYSFFLIKVIDTAAL